MVQIGSINISPPLINTACPWASDLSLLQKLYDCPNTGAVTTRTATLNGFVEDGTQTVVFMKDSVSSLNSYGYSPHPLASYISWVETLLTTPTPSGDLPTKPVIMSITSSDPEELQEMLTKIQELRRKLKASSSLVAVELNTSCPNIKDHPPPAYEPSKMSPLLDVFASFFAEDPTLTIGLKLPPYLYSTLFDDVVRVLEKYSVASPTNGETKVNPFAFVTCTNTLGSSLLLPDQVSNPAANGASFALPVPFGGLAGEALHALALGNVHAFSQRFASHPDPSIKGITIIGVGGVTTSEAVARMHTVGAKVVGCATVLGAEGVEVFERLLQAAP